MSALFISTLLALAAVALASNTDGLSES